LNPKTARSQVIGAMTMGAGAALMEELAVDKRRGFFVNHDLAGYEVPVHADIPHQDVVLMDETDVAARQRLESTCRLPGERTLNCPDCCPRRDR
jgi:CO/xanthine dehydrogenase Mo-binding subunit